MDNEKCDLIHPNGVKEKKMDVIDGYTIKYHANGNTIWSKGKMVDDQPEGYWEWYRPDGTTKRSGYFEKGEPVGEWITYDNKGAKHKITQRAKKDS
jgi:antitoxin component YwqK of YwqJK toxin-antitoxin module